MRPEAQLGLAIRMAKRSGTTILPLHGGRVPPWLATRMSSLGAVITQAIVRHYGRDEFLQRLSHPFWFQSFGAVMGMDWHSSGITTSVIETPTEARQADPGPSILLLLLVVFFRT